MWSFIRVNKLNRTKEPKNSPRSIRARKPTNEQMRNLTSESLESQSFYFILKFYEIWKLGKPFIDRYAKIIQYFMGSVSSIHISNNKIYKKKLIDFYRQFRCLWCFRKWTKENTMFAWTLILNMNSLWHSYIFWIRNTEHFLFFSFWYNLKIEIQIL